MKNYKKTFFDSLGVSGPQSFSRELVGLFFLVMAFVLVPTIAMAGSSYVEGYFAEEAYNRAVDRVQEAQDDLRVQTCAYAEWKRASGKETKPMTNCDCFGECPEKSSSPLSIPEVSSNFQDVPAIEPNDQVIWKEYATVKATVYNPRTSQTEGNPCVGASSRNLCNAHSSGQKTLAMSRDISGYFGGSIRFGQKVKIECHTGSGEESFFSGVFSAEDHLSTHWGKTVPRPKDCPAGTRGRTCWVPISKQVDIFHPTKSSGICTRATLYVQSL